MLKSGRSSGSEAAGFSKVLAILAQHYTDSAYSTALNEISKQDDPFRVLIGTVLSQRTRDEVTAETEQALFREYPDAASLSAADRRHIERLIRRVGFYRTKAKAVKDISRDILDRFGGKVPHDMESLLSLPMVGRKTANCVLVYGFGMNAIPVDTHVHRISNRLGWVKTKKPEETERALVGMLPKETWLAVNELMVTHGKNICRPIGPLCQRCPVAELCAYWGDTSSTRNTSP